MKLIASKTFKSHITSETSMSAYATQLGEHESTMDFYMDEEGTRGFIEWDIPDLEMGAEIGLWFEEDKKTLCDYDGVFSLPEQAIELLEENGYNADYAK